MAKNRKYFEFPVTDKQKIRGKGVHYLFVIFDIAHHFVEDTTQLNLLNSHIKFQELGDTV
jgi:hypothetical protein